MLKVTGSTMPGALSLMSITVFATSDDGSKEAVGAAVLDRDDLSLYTAPQQRVQSVEPGASQLEQNVAALRDRVKPYAAWCQGAYGNIKPGVQRVIQFGSDTYAYLNDPPKDFYARAGVIGFTGVLGLFLARGSRIKRLVYPAGLVAVSSSLYYPEQAAAVAKSTGDSVYERAVRSFATVEKMLKTRGGDKTDAGSEPKP
ncbi:MICOS complex subunit MIC26-like [Genypterus blacodes]|uniref:MICOS complex subunit MIC26-like n=1 Tax=Genypterus blacodes TaxID=154954 RepID=UPI003F760680